VTHEHRWRTWSIGPVSATEANGRRRARCSPTNLRPPRRRRSSWQDDSSVPGPRSTCPLLNRHSRLIGCPSAVAAFDRSVPASEAAPSRNSDYARAKWLAFPYTMQTFSGPSTGHRFRGLRARSRTAAVGSIDSSGNSSTKRCRSARVMAHSAYHPPSQPSRRGGPGRQRCRLELVGRHLPHQSRRCRRAVKRSSAWQWYQPTIITFRVARGPTRIARFCAGVDRLAAQPRADRHDAHPVVSGAALADGRGRVSSSRISSTWR
jgi:hypothetical protein